MQGLIDWLVTLPTALLYLVLAVVSAVENVFPPIPADTIVALGSWLAARGTGSIALAFAAPVLGNLAGAAGMFCLGRRHGADWMHRRFPAIATARNEQRLEALYGRYGVLALVFSRFIPGLRALVPPFAGALQVPIGRALLAMGVASTVWYGTISVLAFRAGANWEALAGTIRHSATLVAAAAGALLLVGVVVWLVRRRRAGAERA
jgi:membrane protein DedA with SNARE-associated domain